jgi:hypothetical protein
MDQGARDENKQESDEAIHRDPGEVLFIVYKGLGILVLLAYKVNLASPCNWRVVI